ncbi:hypothetical protein [Streptomyces nymphaeiformis]|uniref:Uncharacterized protein n=1 Tax=Streptomyces nymphaeiformis TaxID=2663842 RepID=A0A7W7XDV3_9ACTN|nr:hypothetical protein [Streptomyces nymphaeiformis]MBB4985129.1 hypothetical protein [Streptomyces nymphaeiformis]
MTRTENELDQIVFRWDSENLTGNTGFGPVAWSGARDETETLFQVSGPVLRAAGEETRPALIRLRRRDYVMLVRRVPFMDADGRTSVLCHALVGAPALLGPAVCLGLHRWDWDGATAANATRARGRLPVVPAEAVVPAASRRGLVELDRLLPYASDELVGAVAEFLRHPDELFTVLDERGDTACPVLWGLHSMLGALTKRPWTFATHDTLELPSLRFAFVGRWSGAASRNTERRRVDPRERCGDRAEEVAARLVRHHLWELEEKGRDRVVGRALRTAATTYGGPLLDAATRAADHLDATDSRTSGPRRRGQPGPETGNRRAPGGGDQGARGPWGQDTGSQGAPGPRDEADRRTPDPWGEAAGPTPGPRNRPAPGPRNRPAPGARGQGAPGSWDEGAPEARHPVSPESRGQGAPGSWDEGAPEARHPISPESRDQGVAGSRGESASGPWDRATLDPRGGGAGDAGREGGQGRRDQAGSDRRDPGTPEPRDQGAPSPWDEGSSGPWGPSPSDPRDRPSAGPRDRTVPDPREQDSPSPRHSGTSDPRQQGASDSRHSGTSGSRHSGTSDPWQQGTSDSRHSGTSDSRHSGTSDPRHSGTSDPRHPGTSDSRQQGASDSRHSGTSDPWQQGTPDSRHPGISAPRHPSTPEPQRPEPSGDVRPDPVRSPYPDSPGPWTDASGAAGPDPDPAVRPDRAGPAEPPPRPGRHPELAEPRGASSWSSGRSDGNAAERPSDQSRPAPASAPEPPPPPVTPPAPVPDVPPAEQAHGGALAHPRPDLPRVGPQWTRPGKGVRRRKQGREVETSLVHKLPTARSVEEARELVVRAGSRELLAALRRPQAYAVVTELVREIARRLPSWGHPMRRELCEVAIARELWAVPPSNARDDPSEPPEEQRAANAAELHRWAVRPLLAGGDAPVGTVAELLARLRTSPAPSAREAFWLIVDGESPGLPDAVWLTLLKEAYGLPRTAPRPSPPPEPERPDDLGNGYTQRFLRRAALLIGGLVVAIVLIVLAK